MFSTITWRTRALCAAVMCLSLASVAQSAPYLRVHNSVQIVDWTSDSFSNSWDNYAATGPLSHREDITFHGARSITEARAEFGSLGFYTQSLSAGSSVTAYADASAAFVDVLTITSPGLEGQTGNLNVWMDVDGTIQGPILHPGVSGGATWEVRLNDSWYSAIDQWDYSTNSGRTSYHGFLRQMATFTYGQPFEFSISFAGSAGSYEGVADFLHTAVFDLQKSQVLDPNGMPITNYSLTAESGHNYLVPEPATLSLLALGGLAMIRRRIGRRAHASPVPATYSPASGLAAT